MNNIVNLAYSADSVTIEFTITDNSVANFKATVTNPKSNISITDALAVLINSIASTTKE